MKAQVRDTRIQSTHGKTVEGRKLDRSAQK